MPERRPSRQRHAIVFFVLLLSLDAGLARAGGDKGSKFDPEANFSGLKTYDWMVETRHRPEGSPLALGGSADTLVRNAIDDQLRAQGFVPATEGEPDFLVTYDGALEPVTDFEGYRRELTAGVSWVMEGSINSYLRGTLVISIHLEDLEHAAWSAWTTETVKDPKSAEKQIRKVVRKLLRGFPPKDR